MFLFSPLLHISMQYLQQREVSYCQLCFIRVQKDFGPPQLCVVLLKYLQIRDVLWNLFREHRRHTHAHPYLLDALTHSQPLTVCPHHVIFAFDLQLAAVVEWQRCGHRPPAGHISELKRHLLLQMLLVVWSTFSCGLLQFCSAVSSKHLPWSSCRSLTTLEALMFSWPDGRIYGEVVSL